MLNFLRNKDGLVTIEWVAIAAVMVLAALGISGYLVQGGIGVAHKVSGGLASVDFLGAPVVNGSAD